MEWQRTAKQRHLKARVRKGHLVDIEIVENRKVLRWQLLEEDMIELCLSALRELGALPDGSVPGRCNRCLGVGEVTAIWGKQVCPDCAGSGRAGS